MANTVKVSLPETNELTTTAQGLVGLLDDLATFGVIGVKVLDVRTEGDAASHFVVQLAGDQLAALLVSNAFSLLTNKYGG